MPSDQRPLKRRPLRQRLRAAADAAAASSTAVGRERRPASLPLPAPGLAPDGLKTGAKKSSHRRGRSLWKPWSRGVFAPMPPMVLENLPGRQRYSAKNFHNFAESGWTRKFPGFTAHYRSQVPAAGPSATVSQQADCGRLDTAFRDASRRHCGGRLPPVAAQRSAAAHTFGSSHDGCSRRDRFVRDVASRRILSIEPPDRPRVALSTTFSSFV